MKLSVSKREAGQKGLNNKQRHEGNIPAVIYSKGGENVHVFIDGTEFKKHLNHIEKGLLATQVFDIDIDGTKERAVVKDIQYHKTTYHIQHIDLQRLDDKQSISINVPLRFTGAEDCAGIKLGGFLRPVKRSLKVRCLPNAIPKSFNVSIKDLGLKQSKRISDIAIPDNVQVESKTDDVVVVIAK